MDTTELKKMVNNYVADIDKRISTIESNVKKRNSWAVIHDKIRSNPTTSDQLILEELTKHFGGDCLKSIIVNVADQFIKDFDEKIHSQSCQLKMIVKP